MINYSPAGGLYPTMGDSLGQYGTGEGPTPESVAVGGSLDVDEALRVGGQASPLVGFVVFAILAALIMWVAQKYGGAGAFSNIKASAYNVLFVSLVAIAGIPIWKALFTFFKVPGVSTWVHTV